SLQLWRKVAYNSLLSTPDCSFVHAGAVCCSCLREAQFPVQKGPPFGGGVGEQDPDLAIANPAAGCATVRPSDVGPPRTFLRQARLIQDQDGLPVAQILDPILTQVIPYGLSVPLCTPQQVLHAVGRGNPNFLGKLPPILSLQGTQ